MMSIASTMTEDKISRNYVMALFKSQTKYIMKIFAFTVWYNNFPSFYQNLFAEGAPFISINFSL